MLDNQRIQVDVRNMPLGVKPKLNEMAKEAGVSLTDYIRTLLCRVVLGPPSPSARIKELMDEMDAPGYVPLT